MSSVQKLALSAASSPPLAQPKSPAAEKAAAPAPVASPPPAAAKQPPGKLVIKAPESAKPVEKRPSVLEGMGQPRDMKSLMEKVAAGMKKQAPATAAPSASEGDVDGEGKPAEESPELASPQDEKVKADDDAAEKPKVEAGETGELPQQDMPAASEEGESPTAPPASTETEQGEATKTVQFEEDAGIFASVEAPPRPTVRGPNFALEAMKIRQAQMENRKSTRGGGDAPRAALAHHSSKLAMHVAEVEAEAALAAAEVPEPQALPAGTLDNNAALTKPKVCFFISSKFKHYKCACII